MLNLKKYLGLSFIKYFSSIKDKYEVSIKQYDCHHQSITLYPITRLFKIKPTQTTDHQNIVFKNKNYSITPQCIV